MSNAKIQKKRVPCNCWRNGEIHFHYPIIANGKHLFMKKVIIEKLKRIMKKRNKTICVDFDGVIHDYSKGWRGIDVYDKPIKGAKEGLQALRAAGWTIIIFTTRNDTPKLREFLDAHGLVYDYINENPLQPVGSEHGKLLEDVYLDDKGITFDGDWEKSINAIQNFKTWQKVFW